MLHITERSEMLTEFMRKCGRKGSGNLGNWGVDGRRILKRCVIDLTWDMILYQAVVNMVINKDL
jgi:hypothetical protein